MYVDAYYDRDKDIIHVAERTNGRREYREYPARYTFYYKDQRGKYESIFGDKLSRFTTTNNKAFKKEKNYIAVNVFLKVISILYFVV
jgi:hypothetical protein